jgi:hypothetical protein
MTKGTVVCVAKQNLKGSLSGHEELDGLEVKSSASKGRNILFNSHREIGKVGRGAGFF